MLLLLSTDLESGGTPTVVRELAFRIHRAGVAVGVACLSTPGPVAAQIRAVGIPVWTFNASSPFDLGIFFRLGRLIRDHDVRTVFSFLIHANTVAAVASITRPHVRWIQSIQTTQPNPRWHWWLQRMVHRFADTIVVPSNSVAGAARERSNIPPEKVVVIPNAIDPADWPTRSPVPALNPRPYPVVFLGRLDPIKDVPTLVTAVAKLGSSVDLHIYGEGSDRARITASIVSDNVTLHGGIDRPQIALESAGVLVLPSLAEGFGLVLIEAMAAGVPVIATDVPGICDVIENEVTGLLVPPQNPDALAAAIRRIVDDIPLRRRLIDTAAKQLNQFTWPRVFESYLKLLQK